MAGLGAQFESNPSISLSLSVRSDSVSSLQLLTDLSGEEGLEFDRPATARSIPSSFSTDGSGHPNSVEGLGHERPDPSRRSMGGIFRRVTSAIKRRIGKSTAFLIGSSKGRTAS